MAPRVLDKKGLHAHVYERPAPNGSGRQVVKESIPDSNLNSPAILPDQSRSAVRNEALALIYLAKYTTIPVPIVVEFVDEPDSPVRLVTEFVENALAPKHLRIPVEARHRLVSRLEEYTNQLHAITDPDCRSFSGPPLFALRLEETHIPIQEWKYRHYSNNSPYVLCHGDLGWHNLLLDPETYEIKSIVDWEYAGFYPVEVESEFWRRKGPIMFRPGVEKCDIDHIIKILWGHREDSATRCEARVSSDQTGSLLRPLLCRTSVPADLTISVGTILSQAMISSRQYTATSLHAIASQLTSDVMARNAIIAQIDTYAAVDPLGKISSMGHDCYSIDQLSELLPKAFSTLANQLGRTGLHFVPLRDHFSAEADIQGRLYEKEKIRALPGTEDEKEESALRAKSREMRTERRNIADQTFKDSEMEKWQAIKEFATSLLTLSTAAESLFPYLADRNQQYPPSQSDPERAFAEYRAENVSAKGGTGGWTIKVEDDETLVQEMKGIFQREWEGKKEERENWIAFRQQGREQGQRQYDREDKKRVTEREKLRSLIMAKAEKGSK